MYITLETESGSQVPTLKILKEGEDKLKLITSRALLVVSKEELKKALEALEN